MERLPTVPIYSVCLHTYDLNAVKQIKRVFVFCYISCYITKISNFVIPRLCTQIIIKKTCSLMYFITRYRQVLTYIVFFEFGFIHTESVVHVNLKFNLIISHKSTSVISCSVARFPIYVYSFQRSKETSLS